MGCLLCHRLIYHNHLRHRRRQPDDKQDVRGYTVTRILRNILLTRGVRTRSPDNGVSPMRKSYPSDLTNKQWAPVLQPLIPVPSTGRPRVGWCLNAVERLAS